MKQNVLLNKKTWSKFKPFGVGVMRFIFLISFSYILLYPIFYMFSNAVRDSVDFIDPSITWVPKNFTWQNFGYAWKTLDYPKAFMQTVTIEVVSAIIEMASCSVFAYGLARFKVPLKGLWMGLLFATILLPDVMLLMPRIENFKHLDFFGILGGINALTGVDLRPDIYNTPLTFYLPSLLGVGLKGGLFIFIYIQFFSGLPAELEEAAWIDGAGPIRTFLQIVVPSSGTVFLTVFIFSFIWHWNDYYLALMYILDNTPLAVRVFDVENQIFLALGEKSNVTYAMQYGTPPAACLLFLAPPVGLFLILQKYFIQSIDRVGIVG